ncbi:CAAX protease family protein [Actinophytocola xinjiangensis]|uniref:CAAX protease family protein n=1 Tax=Actinophytocola xinjiangensis TaxID=485602 RepID=A0A7Z0WS79_9PSEU|nr:CPBP family intramembrane glutamic endopeptidase [Actinophytocola xinjiangensis]OLF11961.1 CAAX protease family protein [Actinophytocola xinjiangensis]
MRRTTRRRLVAATAVTGTGLLGASLAARPGSARFYVLTAATAATWAGGAALAGRIRWGHTTLAVPAALGVAAFVPFYLAALVCRRIRPLRRVLTSVLAYAHRGSTRAVLATTLLNGVAEELFFRDTVYVVFGGRHRLATSTGVYAAATTATRNPALVAASVVMGVLFGLQRQVTGGVRASMVTHLVWSTLMVTLLPPLFPPPAESPAD